METTEPRSLLRGILRTEKGQVMHMRYLPDGEQMKSADAYTIEKIGIPSLVLMERAALKVVEALYERKMDLSRVLVVCGSGNNGGDGFAVARLLHERGVCVEVLFAGRESSLSEECALQKQIAERMGIPVFTDLPDREYTVVTDALFGVGLKREISGKYAKIIEWMNVQACRKVAVDIPSGVCAQTGRILGIAFRAELTVSMECVKLGCELFPGKSRSGETIAAPIGISTKIFDGNTEVCFTYDREDIPLLLPVRSADSHKGSYGKVLMITGSSGMAGACFLSAKAAYSVGAGLVQVYTAEENRSVIQQLLPEAIVSCYGGYDHAQLSQLLGWADVVCIGSGLGTDGTSEKILIHTLKEAHVPCVIDADGLNLLSRHKELLKESRMTPILTPHVMEMSRLTGKSVGEIKTGRMEILRGFIEEYPVVCALKDSRTVVAQRGRQMFLNLAGNNAMAKAGSGDVLAGTITGLLAQGLDVFEGAELGVFLHACGGDEARREKGAYSVLARDLISGIAKILCKQDKGEN